MNQLFCASCKVQECLHEPGTRKLPAYCPGMGENEIISGALDITKADYSIPAERILAIAAAKIEAEGYGVWPRIEEVMHFATELGARHLGIAACVGLIRESRVLQEILEANGFRVSSVCCKVDSIDKLDLGLTQAETLFPDGGFDPACNPIGQARALNAVETDLNLLVGLCVGHDTLFFKYSVAPATVVVVKDRVTGHNPAAALYTSHHYYKNLNQSLIEP